MTFLGLAQLSKIFNVKLIQLKISFCWHKFGLKLTLEKS